MSQLQTVISTDTSAIRQVELACGSGGSGYLGKTRVSVADTADVRDR